MNITTQINDPTTSESGENRTGDTTEETTNALLAQLNELDIRDEIRENGNELPNRLSSVSTTDANIERVTKTSQQNTINSALLEILTGVPFFKRVDNKTATYSLVRRFRVDDTVVVRNNTELLRFLRGNFQVSYQYKWFTEDGKQDEIDEPVISDEKFSEWLGVIKSLKPSHNTYTGIKLHCKRHGLLVHRAKSIFIAVCMLQSFLSKRHLFAD